MTSAMPVSTETVSIPPPDLVIEVEITTSAIRKLELFAAMGVREDWRHDGKRIQNFG
jgi:Uma2 family endonuclease